MASADLSHLAARLSQCAHVIANPSLASATLTFQQAQDQFIHFREQPGAYKIAMQLLDIATDDHLLFHIVSAVESVCRDWRMCSREDIQAVIQRLFAFSFKLVEWKPELLHVFRQAHKIIAVVCKRCLAEVRTFLDGSKSPELVSDVLDGLLPLLQKSGVQVFHAISVLSHILVEMASVRSGGAYPLPLRAHYQCKSTFQERHLLKVWKTFLASAAHLLSLPSQLPSFTEQVTRTYLTGLVTIMTWNFNEIPGLDDYPRGSRGEERVVAFAPDRSWRNELVDQVHIDTFLNLYESVKGHAECSAMAMECVSQLASVVGTRALDDSDDLDATFLRMLLTGLQRLNLSTVRSEVAHGVAAIFNNLVEHAHSVTFSALDPGLLRSLFGQFSRCTITIAENSLLEENTFSDERPFSDAFETLLGAWGSLVVHESLSVATTDGLAAAAQTVLETFLKLHLGPPLGYRQLDSAELASEIDEHCEPDRVAYADQLYSVGELARFTMAGSLDLLNILLDKISFRLESLIHTVHSQSLSKEWKHQTDSLMEDFNWVASICGHFLFGSEPNGADIPHAVMMFSLSQQTNQNLEAATAAFRSLDGSLDVSLPGNVDPCLRLMFGMFRLFALLRAFNSDVHKEICSPELLSTILWFCSKWTRKYLGFSPSYYSEVPYSYVRLFGNSGSVVAVLTKYMVDTARHYLANWSGEEEVSKEAVEVFACLARNQHLKVILNPAAQQLMLDFVEFRPYVKSLFPSVKRHMASALGTAVLTVSDPSLRLQYWEQLTSSCFSRVRNVLTAKTPSEVEDVVDLCQILLGIGSCMETTLDEMDVLQFLSPLTTAGLQIIALYPDEPEILCTTVEIFELTVASMSPDAKVDNFVAFMEDICVLSKSWRRFVGVKAPRKDSDEQEVVCFASLLSGVACCASRQRDSTKINAVTKTITRGVTALLHSLQEYEYVHLFVPDVCENYFSMMRNTVQFAGDAFLDLDEHACATVLASVQLGFSSMKKNTLEPCASFVFYLGCYCSKLPPETLNPRVLGSTVRSCLRIVLQAFFESDFPMSCVLAGSEALFGLLCCLKVDYDAYMDSFVQNIPENSRSSIGDCVRNLVSVKTKFIPNHGCATVFQNHFVSAYCALKSVLVFR